MEPISSGVEGTIDPLAILDHLPVAVLVIDKDTVVRWMNRPAEELVGWPSAHVVGTPILDYVDTSWNPFLFDSVVYAFENPGLRLPTLYRLKHADGSTLIVEVTANNQLDDPAVEGLVVHVRVVEEDQRFDELLESLAAGDDVRLTLRRLVDVAGLRTLRSRAAVLVRDDGRWTTFARSADPIPELGPDDPATPWSRVLETRSRVLVDDLDELPAELAAQARTLGLDACWASPVALDPRVHEGAVLALWRTEPGEPEPNATALMDRLTQVTSVALTQHADRAALAYAAAHDALTGLANRAQFIERTEALLEGHAPLGVLYLDLDDFKPVNDRLGHRCGDLVLVEVARRLTQNVRPGDLVARLGGDEFAVACPGATAEDLEGLAARLVEAASAPIEADGSTVQVGLSIGGAEARPDHREVDQLVASADGALLAVKTSGKGGWRLAPVV